MKRFLTIFPYAENVHLIKDVGMIPYILHESYGYDSYLASYKNGKYPYLLTEVKGLKHICIDKVTGISTVDVLIFLILNFKKYDLLQCYHLNFRGISFLLFFKFLKLLSFKKSITFLKLDAVKEILDVKLNYLQKMLLKPIEIVSVETKHIYNFLKENNTLGRDIDYIPNGYYRKDNQEKTCYGVKENLIITVGRIGSYPKNNEVLLEAFAKFSSLNSSWNLEIIGPIESEFVSYIDDYFERYPDLKGRVIFTGSIADRNTLEVKYSRAKIFALTSRSEGFPLVFLEAMRFGCTIVSSELLSAYDVTNNQKYGVIFPIGDVDALTEELLMLTGGKFDLKENCNSIQDFADRYFAWQNIVHDINRLIEQRS